MRTMQPPFTLQDWKRLPEGFPAQLVAGCLVKESVPLYGHQRIAGRIYAVLVALVGPDRAVFSPVAVVLSDVDVFQPDVAVLETTPADDAPDVGIPVLVVEVLSPSTRRRDRTYKATRYLEAGVAEVWLVDPMDRWIEVRTRTGATRHAGRDAVRSNAVFGLELVPATLFARP